MSKQLTFYYFLGLPGSGKSYQALEMVEEHKKAGTNLIRVNKDEIRSSHPNWDEKKVCAERDRQIEEALAQGFHVVSDDTNLNPVHPHRFKELARQYGANLKCIDLRRTPLAKCIAQDAQREGRARVGEDVIKGMAAQWMKNAVPSGDPLADPSLPVGWIFDIDGTIARMGDRGPFEEKYHLDEPILPTIEVMRALQARGDAIVVCSGRQGTDLCKKQTTKWLADNDIWYTDIHFRSAFDHRKDAVVKREIYEQLIRPKYRILGVFDDRPQVIRAWSQLQLFVFDVGPGYEF